MKRSSKIDSEYFYKYIRTILQNKSTNKKMSEIWELFDSFCCKFCYKQFTSDLLPVFICRNQHYCCKYCLQTIYQLFKVEKPSPEFQCPTCQIPVEAQFIKEYKRLLDIKEATLKILQQEKRLSGKKQPSCLNKKEEDLASQLQKQRINKINELNNHITQLSTQNESLWKAYTEQQNKIRQLQQENTNLGELNRQIQHQVQEKYILLDKVRYLTNIKATLEAQVFTLKKQLRMKNSQISNVVLQSSMISQNKQTFSFSKEILPEEKVEQKRSLLQYNEPSFFMKAKFQAYKLSDGASIPPKAINNNEAMSEQEEFVYQSPVSDPANKQENN